MMKIRGKTVYHFKQTGSSEIYSQHRTFCNHGVNEVKLSKKAYFQHYFAENKSNMKLLWKGIKNVIKMKNTGVTSLSPFIANENGTKIADPQLIASNFNEYFFNIANNITSKIPRNAISPLRYLAPFNTSSFFITTC